MEPIPNNTLAVQTPITTTTYQIKKFDIQRVSNGPTITVVIGKRHKGKTTLIRDLLWQMREFPTGVAINATEPCMHEYEKIMPKSCIYDEYKTETIEVVVKRQTDISKRKYKDVKTNGKSAIDARAFLVVDDGLYSTQTLKRDEMFRYLFMNGRFINLNSIIAMEYPLGIGPELRYNIDYIFLFKTYTPNEAKRIYELYGVDIFPSFEAFYQVFDQCTQEPYHCMVIDQTYPDDKKMEDRVFWYCAELHDDFKLCAT